MKYCIIFLLSASITACQSADSSRVPSHQDDNPASSVARKDRQLNIQILLDLSDRIDSTKNPDNPEHYQKDLSIVRHFSEWFVKDMGKRGTYMSKGKIKVFFNPQPRDPNVNSLAEKLDIDLSHMDVPQKKQAYDNLVQSFSKNLQEIYRLTFLGHKAGGGWDGSDIWRFFKDDAQNYCISRDTGYRNILVLVTDGYIYHKDSKEQNGNQYAYLLPSLLDKYHLRNNQQWESEIKRQHFGLLPTGANLNDLDVLVLEINPTTGHKDDEDIIKYVLSDWLTTMHVKKKEFYESNLPVNTDKMIDNFLN